MACFLRANVLRSRIYCNSCGKLREGKKPGDWMCSNCRTALGLHLDIARKIDASEAASVF